MGFYRKWKPSKTAINEFKNEMNKIETFCKENNIIQSFSGDSYYFTINNQNYRVSNHTIETSNLNSGGKWHDDKRRDDTIYIHASKTRIIEIYNNLKAGKKLDGRGYILN